MPDQTEALVLQMSADIRRMEKALTNAAGQTDRQLSKVEKRFDKLNQHVKRSGDRMASDLRAAIAAVAVGAIVKGVTNYADAWTEAGNKIAAAGVKHDQVGKTLSKLADIATTTRADFSATVDLYSRMTRATNELGLSQEQLFRATTIANKAFKAGGASLNEQKSAVLQLGQALGSGTLSGDELRAIRENAPLLAKAIADEFNVTLAGLKKLGETGKLTSDRVFKAILNAGQDIEKQFAATTSTVSDSFTNLTTATIRYVGEADKASGATKALSGFINAVAKDFDKFADAAIVAAQVLGGLLAAGAVVGLVRALGTLTAGLTAATTAAVGLRVATSFFLGPWGVAVLAIGAAVATFALELTETERAATRADRHLKEMRATIEATDDIVKNSRLGDLSEGLNRIESSADFATRRMKELNTEMEISGQLAKEMAKNAQFDANFNLGNDIADLERRLAKLQAPKRFRDRDLPGTTVGSAQDIALLTNKLNNLNAELARGQQRLLELGQTPRKAFLGGAGAARGGSGSLNLDLRHVLNPNEVNEFTERTGEGGPFNEEELVNSLNTLMYDSGLEKFQALKENVRDSVKEGLRQGLVDDDWGSALRNILATAITSAMDESLNKLADLLTDFLFGTKSGGGVLSTLGNAIFGGGRAGGGPLAGGRAYKVNENEGEFLYMPKGGGGQVLTPQQMNRMTSGAGGGVAVHIDARNFIGGVDMATWPQVEAALQAQTRAIAQRLPSAVNATLIDNRRQKRRI